MNTIEINGKNYKFKQSYRAIMLWEEISKRPFEITNTTDNLLYYYCVLLGNNREDCITFDEFLDALDDNPTLLIELTKKLTKSEEIEKMLNPNSDNDNSEDKKKE